jgi:hypothetical protein
MPDARKRPCRICRRWFRPDNRVGDRQRACGNPDCQKARRQKTQASWRRRNPGYATAHRITQRNQDEAAEPVRTPPPLNQLPWDLAKDQFGGQGADFIGVMGTLILKTAKDQFQAFRVGRKRLPGTLPAEPEKTRSGPVHTGDRADATGVSSTGPPLGKPPGTASGALVLERSLRMSEPESALEQGWLLAEMESRLGCSIEDLAQRFDRSKTWVAGRLAWVETLPQSVQQLVREGKVAASLAMRYLAPAARINREHCQRMAAAFAEQPWTARQAGAFYQAWRQASGAVRERILAAPKLFAKAQAQPDPLDKELNRIAAIAQRALEHLESPPPNRAAVRRKLERAIELLTELQQRIEEPETNHVEPSATSHDTRTRSPGSGETGDRAAAEDLPAKRPPGAEGGLQRRAEDRAVRESHAVPPTDPRVAAPVQRQSRASP